MSDTLHTVLCLQWTYSTASVCPLHLGQATHFSVEHVHLLHQAAKGRFCGLTHFLIDTLGLHHKEIRLKKKYIIH